MNGAFQCFVQVGLVHYQAGINVDRDRSSGPRRVFQTESEPAAHDIGAKFKTNAIFGITSNLIENSNTVSALEQDGTCEKASGVCADDDEVGSALFDLLNVGITTKRPKANQPANLSRGRGTAPGVLSTMGSGCGHAHDTSHGLALVGAFCAFYVFWFSDHLAMTARSGLPTQTQVIIGSVGIVVLLEASRRALRAEPSCAPSFFSRRSRLSTEASVADGRSAPALPETPRRAFLSPQ